MIRLGPGQASASRSALIDWASLAPSAIWATKTLPYARAIAPRSFLPVRLAGRRELRDRAARGGLGRLAAGVGVDLGVEDEDVDVAARREDLVQPAEADVVGPAVAADDPDALLHEVRGQGQQLAGVRRVLAGDAVEDPAQLRHALALGDDLGLGVLRAVEQLGGEGLADDRREPARRAAMA